MAKYEASEVAAKWWADKLDGTAKQDNGAPEMAGGFGALLMMMSSMMNAVDAGKREEFRAILEAKVDEALERYGSCNLMVDYGAEGLLALAAQQVGINCGTGSAFPVKTFMTVSKESVKVSYGYGATPNQIYKQDPTKASAEGNKNSDGGRV